MTPRQLQIARRLHHQVAGQPPRALVAVEAGLVLELLNLVWSQTGAIDVAEAQAVAEDRLEELLGVHAGSLPTARAAAATGERRSQSAPPRQLTFSDAPHRRPNN